MAKPVFVRKGNGMASLARIEDKEFVKPLPRRPRRLSRLILESLPVSVAISTSVDPIRLLYVNARACEQFCIPRGRRKLPSPSEFYVHAEDRERMLETLNREGGLRGYPVLMRRLDGSTFWDLLSVAQTSFDNQPALISCHYDINDHKVAEAAFRESEERYALVARGVNDGIWDWNLVTGRVSLSPRLLDMLFDNPAKRVLDAEDWLSHVHLEDLPRLRKAIASHLAGETSSLDVEYRLRDNPRDRDLWLGCRGIALRDAADKPVRMAGSQTDITARKRSEIKLKRAAYVDPLTALSNRAHFIEYLETISRAGSRRAEGRAVLVIRLRRLQRLSDSLGRNVIEGILIAVAARLQATCLPDELVARIAMDEFALLTAQRPLDVCARAAEVWELLTQPITVGETEFEVGILIGISYLGLGRETGEEIIREAHLALEWSSSSEGDAAIFVFDETTRPQQQRRSRIEADLPAALRAGEIFVEYQPVVTLGTGSFISFEALARWRHAELGIVPPNEFIPVAEQSGAIQRLGDEVLRQAAAQLATWEALGLSAGRITIAVNFSASQLAESRNHRKHLAGGPGGPRQHFERN
jgi:diguanylate cyclase (GGDEF)-like protein